METTFMTIHNLTPEANIMYASDSIADVLEFEPHEVLGKSCFEYFHPSDVPFARSVHSQGVYMEQAAVIHYARILKSDGTWQDCECVFTVVHDVLVACTSIYRREKPVPEGAEVARINFTQAPKDPRYHMLEHLSAKFRMPSMENTKREPRAALILNRFTRSLTIMYCTDAIVKVLGITKEYMVGKSFYECIDQGCLRDAITSIESAKGNDSIAYVRFHCRDPRYPHELAELNEALDENSDVESEADDNSGLSRTPSPPSSAMLPTFEPVTVEAVISCTSDGLVVILRKAPELPANENPQQTAAPWGTHPVQPHEISLDPNNRFQHGPKAPEKNPNTPDSKNFLKAIREVAVFAWGLAGINGNIASYGKGKGRAEAVPPAFPVYEPHGPASSFDPPINQAQRDWDRRKSQARNTKHSIGFIVDEERAERKRRRLNGGTKDAANPPGYAQPGNGWSN